MRCIKTGFVAEVSNCRFYGDAFIVCNDETIPYHDHPLPGAHWLLLRIVEERTAVEDWHTLGPVDHILAETWDIEFNDGPRARTMLIAPGDWNWLGYYGVPFTR